jgi:transcriptional regulator with XRE-family HTH domain
VANREKRAYTARGPVEGEDWSAVAHALNERMAARRMGQQELAAASGVSVSTLRQLQHGVTGRRVQNKTLTAIADALGWPTDHLVRILLADEPPQGPAADDMERFRADLEALRGELRQISRRLDALESAPPAQPDTSRNRRGTRPGPRNA